MGAAAWPRSSAPATGSLCCARGPVLLPPALEVLHGWEAAVGNTGLFWGYFGGPGCSSAKIRETNPAGQGRGRWCRACFPLGALLILQLSGLGPAPAGTLRGGPWVRSQGGAAPAWGLGHCSHPTLRPQGRWAWGPAALGVSTPRPAGLGAASARSIKGKEPMGLGLGA